MDLAGVWGLVRRSHGDIEVIVLLAVEVSVVVYTIASCHAILSPASLSVCDVRDLS